MSVTPLRSTFQIKALLTGIHPPIWRRILVASDITLGDLHDILQVVFGWQDAHLHQFTDGKQTYGEPDSGARNEYRVRLDQVFKREGDAILYEYDFGDRWQHKVVLEELLPFHPQIPLPQCTGGKRACPPEDIGGAPGYQHLLDVLSDRTHPDHQDMAEWFEDFDPEEFNLKEADAELEAYYREARKYGVS